MIFRLGFSHESSPRFFRLFSTSSRSSPSKNNIRRSLCCIRVRPNENKSRIVLFKVIVIFVIWVCLKRSPEIHSLGLYSVQVYKLSPKLSERERMHLRGLLARSTGHSLSDAAIPVKLGCRDPHKVRITVCAADSKVAS